VSKQSFSPGPEDYLTGAVCEQWRRCGKPNCRCRAGRLHGPYHYRFWREFGRLRKEYVRPEELAEVREKCARWRELQAELRNGRQEWKQMMRTVRAVIREANQIMGPLR
jgi:hypothetical protein